MESTEKKNPSFIKLFCFAINFNCLFECLNAPGAFGGFHLLLMQDSVARERNLLTTCFIGSFVAFVLALLASSPLSSLVHSTS